MFTALLSSSWLRSMTWFEFLAPKAARSGEKDKQNSKDDPYPLVKNRDLTGYYLGVDASLVAGCRKTHAPA